MLFSYGNDFHLLCYFQTMDIYYVYHPQPLFHLPPRPSDTDHDWTDASGSAVPTDLRTLAAPAEPLAAPVVTHGDWVEHGELTWVYMDSY